jgi:hypothetical protein
VWCLESTYTFEVLASRQVEHLDRSMHFSGDEKVIALQIYREVIEITNDIWKIGNAEQGYRLLLCFHSASEGTKS